MRRTILLLFISVQALAGTVMVSHKGVWKDHIYPQNTLAAIKKAVERGFLGVEFDLMLTKDKKFILSHEESLKKVSNCEGNLSEKTLEQMLQCKVDRNTILPITQIIVKKVKKPQPYVTLREVLKYLFSQKQLKFIWFDIKNKNPEVVELLYNELRHFPDSFISKINLNNTQADILIALKNLLPAIETSLEGKWGSEPLIDYEKYVEGIGKTHTTISLNVGIHMGDESPLLLIGRKHRFMKQVRKLLSLCEQKGITVIGWTVNSKRKIKRFQKLEIPYLLTDRTYPELK